MGIESGIGVFDTLQNVLPILFVVVLGIIAFSAVRGIGQWRRNNKQPVLSVSSRVVSKRTQVTHHHHNNEGIAHFHTDTFYYVTFQVESGDRMEFKVNGKEYGLLAEEDAGKLTFQGTRFFGFERERMKSLSG